MVLILYCRCFRIVYHVTGCGRQPRWRHLYRLTRRLSVLSILLTGSHAAVARVSAGSPGTKQNIATSLWINSLIWRAHCKSGVAGIGPDCSSNTDRITCQLSSSSRQHKQLIESMSDAVDRDWFINYVIIHRHNLIASSKYRVHRNYVEARHEKQDDRLGLWQVALRMMHNALYRPIAWL